MQKKQIRMLSIVGTAGHGKGVFKDEYIKNLDDPQKLKIVSYSSAIKRQISEAFLTPKIMEKFNNFENKIDLLNHLKDKAMDFKVYKNFNMREMLQAVGTELYREIDENIHIRFEYSKMLNHLEKEGETIFLSDDTRFPNEFENALKLNMLETNSDLIDYLKYFLSDNDKMPTEDKLKKSIEKIFDVQNSNEEEYEILQKFINLAIIDMNNLKIKYVPEKDWSSLRHPETSGISVKEGLEVGVISLFRPIINPEQKNSTNIFHDIERYTGLNFLEIKNIKKCYESSDIEWTIENIHKHGFARSNISHYSETAINDRKPISIIVKPLKSIASKKTYEAQVKNIMNGNEWVNTIHNSNNTLRIVFSAGSLFDTKEAESIFQEKGITQYKEYLQEMEDNNQTFSPGPALGLYMAFKKLNDSIPDDILKIDFGLITKIPATFPAFWDTYEELIERTNVSSLYEFDFMSFGQDDTAQSHLGACADLAFVTSKATAEKLYSVGVPAIYIPNISKKNNLEMYEKRNGGIMLASDFDGVIADTNSERQFQSAIKNGHDNPVEHFRKYEKSKEYMPMDLGPMGNVIKKLNIIEKENEKHKLETNSNEIKYKFNFTIITARDGKAAKRFMNTLKEHGIEVKNLHMMSGLNKNNPLKIISLNNKSENILFIDDGEVHFTRANDLEEVINKHVINKPSPIISGYVVNDYNYENQKKINKIKNKI